ncbi:MULTISPECIES: DNA helicase [Streptomyces]|uniref:DNA helicase n=1 Tax=Streptomyces TaxID=1883 RepID=UPI000A6A822E|nr:MULTISPECIES: DNA helicase [Streptomyces]
MTLTYLDLVPEQRSCLDGLPFDGNHLISGPPGSGKSLLAVQRAIMLALTGTPAVLLTRSNLLRQSLAATAHAWLTEWYGGQPPRGTDGWFDWPAFYDRAVETGPVPGLTLVVDEGQDLPPEFYRLCRLLGARTTVLADECQRLTDANSTLAEIAERLGRCTCLALDGNHRNTRQIASFAAHFHTGTGLPVLPEREGPPPRLHRLPNGGAADLLILLAQRHPQQRIGVIVNSTDTQFSLLGSLERRAPRLKPQLYTSRARAAQGRYRKLDLGRPGIVLIHRASAKGLGFDTVVIPDTHTDAAVDPTSAACA